MKNIAIIPARGGSRRIPQKNIVEFCGRPIIKYSIDAALESNLFDEVMVSTDSECIADVARQSGANVPFLRSARNSDDKATTADALLEVLQQYEERGQIFDGGCCIYPASPLMSADNIYKAYEVLKSERADSVISVVRFSSPVQRALRVQNGNLVLLESKYLFTRTQDLEEFFYDAGQFYWFSVKKFLEQKTLMMVNAKPFVLSETHSQDIDCEEDLILAKMKFQYLRAMATCDRDFHGDNMILRKVEKGDLYDVFEWRNHEMVRKSCFHDGVVELKEHEKWFAQKIADPDCCMYIGLLNREKIGIIRFEQQGTKSVVNVHLNPLFLGRGIGSKLIEQGTNLYNGSFSSSTIVEARIKEDNVASQKSFAKAGYIEESRDNGIIVMVKKI